jgi:hypothetical protein
MESTPINFKQALLITNVWNKKFTQVLFPLEAFSTLDTGEGPFSGVHYTKKQFRDKCLHKLNVCVH